MLLSSVIQPRCFEINWELSYKCNYNCYYCYTEQDTREVTYAGAQFILKQIDKLFDVDLDVQKIFCILGGEPTIHPDFLKILDYISKNVKNFDSLVLSSNASRSESFHHDMAKIMQTDSRMVYSPTFHPSQGMIEDMVNKCLLVQSYGVSAPIKLMADINYFDDFKNAVDYVLSKTNLAFTIKMLHKHLYTDSKQIDYLRELIKHDRHYDYMVRQYYLDQDQIVERLCSRVDMVLNDELNYTGYYCNKWQFLNVNNLGLVLPLCKVDYSKHDLSNGILIVDKNLDMIKEHIFKTCRCKNNTNTPCHCIIAPKFKLDYEYLVNEKDSTWIR